jgi:ectoine hydroxylase-related dioxygenase (phytanoyl-CoA dioxygenase family)
VEGVLSPAGVASVRAALDPLVAAVPTGRNAFEGHRTRRVYSLLAKTRAFDGAVLHPLVLEVADRLLGHHQLSATVAISIAPGETAQLEHYDDVLYPLPRPHDEVMLSTMWAIDDFTRANGATVMLPGSHRWTSEHPDATSERRCAEMPAGSVAFYLGSLWHGGGANATDTDRLGVTIEYIASWLRPQENHLVAVPREVVSAVPERLQELLGYNVRPPFVGYVDGRHPRHVL